MNRAVKKLLLRLVFSVECLAFALFFVKSLNIINNMKINNFDLEEELTLLNQDSNKVQKQIDEWNSDSFYKEQLAREQLQMANSKDEIYYV